MSKKVQEAYNYLEELIRSAYNNLLPGSVDEEIEYVTNREFRDKFIQTKPRCFLPIKKLYGEPVPFLPICNRAGVIEPKIIDFSLKVCRRLEGLEDYDKEHLKGIVLKLQSLHKKYSKENPKPISAAILKARDTRNFKRNMGN